MAQQAIVLKSKREIEKMREAGKIAGLALRKVAAAAQPGATTAHLDEIAEREIRAMGAIPSFKGLYDYPASLCTSINDEIVHGIPSKKRVLKSGDLIKLDIGALLDGFHSDTAMTVAVGNVSPEAAELIRITEAALWAGIERARAGLRIRDISAAIEEYINAHGTYGIVRQYVGHGIGRQFHEEPQVPNYVDSHRPVNLQMRQGLVIAIEPMVNIGTWDTKQHRGDSWTVYTADGSLSAHFEHTVAVGDGDPQVLTLPE